MHQCVQINFAKGFFELKAIKASCLPLSTELKQFRQSQLWFEFLFIQCINYENKREGDCFKRFRIHSVQTDLETIRGIWTKRGIGHGLPYGLSYVQTYGLPVVIFFKARLSIAVNLCE